ncbi:RING-type domain-containing protein [Entamoeba marina]
MSEYDDQYYALVACTTGTTLIHDDPNSSIISISNSFETLDTSFKSFVTSHFFIQKEIFPQVGSVQFKLLSAGGIDVTDLEDELSTIINDDSNEINLFALYTTIQTYLETNTFPSGYCVICYEQFEEESVKQLPCFHYFHSQCIDNLIRSGAKPLCPTCRAPFRHISRFAQLTKSDSFLNFYYMEDEIFDPCLNELCNYCVIVKNSGIRQSHHIFMSFFNKYSPLKAEYNDNEKGWIVSFQYQNQANDVIKHYNNHSVLPNYPKMCIETFETTPNEIPCKC